jgi:glycosyltransferase involved in cell wall biosynthesis
LSDRKINFILPGKIKSGGMKIIVEYGNRLSKRGYDVKMYYPVINYHHFTGSPDYTLNFSNAKEIIKNILKRFINNDNEINFKIEITPLIKNYFIRDAIASIATYWPTSFSVNSLNKSKGKKIYFIQGYEIWCNNIKKVDESYRLPMERITISNYLHDLLIDKFNAESEVILNSLDFTFFSDFDKNFDKKNKVITFIDYELETKNVNACIDTIKIINNNFDNVKFICFGLKKFHEMPNYINFIEDPSVEEIKNVYRKSDIFLFTSKREGFALPPAEAMACKCAVVTSEVGAVPEYSTNNVSAMFIDPNNVTEIVNVITALLSDNNRLKQISENGYKAINQKLNWENSLDKFEKIILK